LPALNVGRRQENRLHSENVIHVEHDRRAITSALDIALHDTSFLAATSSCRNVYGDGMAGMRTVEAIRDLQMDSRLLVKRMAY